jgi:hypothetical protein
MHFEVGILYRVYIRMSQQTFRKVFSFLIVSYKLCFRIKMHNEKNERTCTLDIQIRMMNPPLKFHIIWCVRHHTNNYGNAGGRAIEP